MSDNNAYDQAVAQANSIDNMVGALNVDYARLEELSDELKSLESDVQNADTEEEKQDALKELAAWRIDNADELRELEEAANGNESEEDAREAIRDDALEVQVRSGWYDPLSGAEGDDPAEFYILLCTGGPAVRIMGWLAADCGPTRAWIEYQDWGTPWAEASGIISQDVLLQYCQQFYFGE
jgi:hypothetical protein